MDQRKLLEGFYHKAVAAVHPVQLMAEHVRRSPGRLELGGQHIDLSQMGKLRVVAIGKAAGPMMGVVESELSDLIEGGVVVVPHGTGYRSDVCTVVEAGHPIPDEGSVRAAVMVMQTLSGLEKSDVVLVLISGGASALLGDLGDIPLPEMQALFDAMLRSGADITEMNTVRKHLCMLKGGRLSALAHPAQVVSLILSDVIGDPLDVIGSGPTVGDPTTWQDVSGIMNEYGLREHASPIIRARIDAGCSGEAPETPKPGDPLLAKASNFLVGSNRISLEAIAKDASWQHYHVVLDQEPMLGEARVAAEVMAYRMATYDGPRPALFIRGGETTVTVNGSGRGGRNQEFALAMLAAWTRMGLKPEQMPTVLAAGTDGIDGPTDAAGGFADASVWIRMKEQGLDPQVFLENNDAYTFLEETDGLFRTGATGTNVADVVIGIL